MVRMRIKTENKAAKAEALRRDAAAFDSAIANAPRKPPPLRTETVTKTASVIALARDIKTGAYVPGRMLADKHEQDTDSGMFTARRSPLELRR